MTNWELLLGELAKTTTEFLEQHSTIKNDEQGESSANTDEFRVSFSIDRAGDLSVEVGWPLDIPPSVTSEVLGNLIHQINTGEWKSVVFDGIKAYGLDTNSINTGDAILERWGELSMKEKGDVLCVDPINVFRGLQQ